MKLGRGTSGSLLTRRLGEWPLFCSTPLIPSESFQGLCSFTEKPSLSLTAYGKALALVLPEGTLGCVRCAYFKAPSPVCAGPRACQAFSPLLLRPLCPPGSYSCSSLCPLSLLVFFLSKDQYTSLWEHPTPVHCGTWNVTHL